jgi:hypothetical protein
LVRGVKKHGWQASACPTWFLDGFAAREEVGDQGNHGDDQQQVNQAAGYVEGEKARSPQA